MVPRLFLAIIGKRPVKDLSKSPFLHSPQCPFPCEECSKILTNLHMLFSSLRNAFPHMVFSQSLEQHSYKVSPSLKILKREQFLIPPFGSVYNIHRGFGGIQEASEVERAAGGDGGQNGIRPEPTAAGFSPVAQRRGGCIL